MSDMGLGLEFEFCRSISSSTINSPAVGQTTLFLGDSSFLEVGDEVTIECDSGDQGSTTVVSVVKSPQNCGNSTTSSYIVVDGVFDLSSQTGCKVCVDNLELSVIIDRLKEHSFVFPSCLMGIVRNDLGFIFTEEGLQVVAECC